MCPSDLKSCGVAACALGDGHNEAYPNLAVYRHELPDKINRIWSFHVGGEISIFKCFNVFLQKSLSKIF